MTALDAFCPPVLSCAEAGELEHRLFQGDEVLEWNAMQAAGRAVAEGIRRDYEEIGALPQNAQIFILAGKGHNAGDALIAARELLAVLPQAHARVLFAFGSRALRPLAARAWRELQHAGRDRVSVVSPRSDRSLLESIGGEVTVSIDGLFGFQFHPPVSAEIGALIADANALPVRLRAAVDLPSADLFRADFTYATGSVKAPLLAAETAGRIRYLDLGFFRTPSEPPHAESSDRVLTSDVLQPLSDLRPAHSDKRHYGHVFLLGGSRGYPGAILMSALSAIRSGAGLVTAFVPESLVPMYAARLPEAMWVGWPETPGGSLALEGEHLLRERLARASVLVMGPGLGREPETLALVTSVVQSAAIPLVLDADALQPGIVLEGGAPRILTPHAGEFARIARGADLRTFAANPQVTMVLKGPSTQVCSGGDVYHSFFGGPVLARGGSGDLLAGMMGTQLAQQPADPLTAAARAVVWHGMAADRLARHEGQVAVATTQILDHLGAVLRELS